MSFYDLDSGMYCCNKCDFYSYQIGCFASLLDKFDICPLFDEDEDDLIDSGVVITYG